jgi:alpha-tubulin suppressor-like RCC1 family protein
VPLAAPATDLGCGTSHCCAALVDGRVECWGSNTDLQLGESGTFPAGAHTVLTLPDVAVRVVAGFRHAVVVSASGSTYGWGDNGAGQITGTGSGAVLPTSMAVTFADPDSVAAGNTFSCFARTYLEPQCLGSIAGYFSTSGAPHTLANDDPGYPNGSGAGAGAGLDHACFILGNGVWCAGADGDGQLGRPGLPPRLVLTPFPALSRAVGATLWATCVASATGVVWCSGDGGNGELGPGRSASSMPVMLDSELRATAISSGDTRHFCAIDLVGRVWCWGLNASGEVGPSASFIARPTIVVGL